jgi:hypothetical protein
MRSLAPHLALVALAVTLGAAAPAAAQQPPGAPTPPGPAAPPPYAAPQYAPPPYAAPQYAPPPYAAPYGWTPVPLPVTQRRNEGMRIAGITFFTAGAVATVAGVATLLAAALHPCADYEDFGEQPPPPAGAAHRERVGTGQQALTSCDGGPTIGFGIIAAGVIGGAVGIPLFVVGNAQVRAPAPKTAAMPAVRLGSSGADLRWTF